MYVSYPSDAVSSFFCFFYALVNLCLFIDDEYRGRVDEVTIKNFKDYMRRLTRRKFTFGPLFTALKKCEHITSLVCLETSLPLPSLITFGTSAIYPWQIISLETVPISYHPVLVKYFVPSIDIHRKHFSDTGAYSLAACTLFSDICHEDVYDLQLYTPSKQKKSSNDDALDHDLLDSDDDFTVCVDDLIDDVAQIGKRSHTSYTAAAAIEPIEYESVSDISDIESSDDEHGLLPVINKYKHEQTLEERYPVEKFDGKVLLYETGRVQLANGKWIDAAHTYVVDGCDGYTSITTVLHKYFGEFDGDAASHATINGKNWQISPYHDEAIAYAKSQGHEEGTSAFKEACRINVLSQWKRNNELGTILHDAIEDYYNGNPAKLSMRSHEREYQYFVVWDNNWIVVQKLRPFRAELRIADRIRKLTGSLDMLFLNEHDELVMVDWKRVIKLREYGLEKVDGKWRKKYAKGCLSHIPDCNKYHYFMQQNLYAYILKEQTGLNIVSMYLLQLHPLQERANLVHVPFMIDEVKAVLQDV